MSYNRKDQFRVNGLVELLKSFDNEIFYDKLSILAGQRWEPKILENVSSAECFIVFWTRNAKKSKWVRKEYEMFSKHQPEKLLIPILGDTTPLEGELAERQAVNFMPLLTDLKDLKEKLSAEGKSKAEIRKAIADKLEEEGLNLKDSALKRLFGFFEVRGAGAIPLIILHKLNGFLLETQLKLVFVAALLVSGALVTGMTLVGKIFVPDITPVAIQLNQTGRQACENSGLVYQSVSQTIIHERVDKNKGLFFGYSTPSCESEIRKSSRCHVQKFEMSNITLVKSTNPVSNKDFSRSNYMCLDEPLYKNANCVNALGD